MNTGQDFAKKIGPFGSVLFLALFAAFLVYCFSSSPKDPLEGYSAPHGSSYYSESNLHIRELEAELKEKVFPSLSGIISAEPENGKLVISIEGENFAESRDSILRHYDEELFYFIRR